MDSRRFDNLARSVSSVLSRRSVSRGLAVAAGAVGVSGLVPAGFGLHLEDVAAKKKKKKDCRKKGCPQPTNPCEQAICKKGKKKKNGKRKYSCVTEQAADDTVCGVDQICRAGVCRDTCPQNSICSGGQTCCNNACVNIQTDFHYCGNCTSGCDADTADQCVGGACQCGAAAACTGGQTCDNGTCGCPAGFTDCSGNCVDLDSDADNCGECGRACPGSSICRNGLLCEAAACLPSTSIGGNTSLASDGGITSVVTLTPDTFGVIRMQDVPSGTTFADIVSLKATYAYTEGACSAGTPRFLVVLDVGGDERCPYASFPPTGPCGTGADGSTGELIGDNTPFIWLDDLCGGSGQGTNTYDEVLALYANATVTQVQVVADASNAIDSTMSINPCVIVSR